MKITTDTSHFQKNIFNDPNIFMVSWWGTYSYFNNEQINIGGI